MILDNVRSTATRVSEMVRDMFSARVRENATSEERDLAVHLSTNEPLYEALCSVIRSRIQGRDQLPVPSDPMMCKSILDRNSELRWLLGRLEFLHRYRSEDRADNSEQPAA